MININLRAFGVLLLCGTVYFQAGCSTAQQTSANSNQTSNSASPTVAKTPAAAPEINAKPKVESPAPKETENVSAKNAATLISKANYEKIKEGMSLAEVEKVLGGEGMKVSTMNVNGRETEIYKWSDDNFASYIDVTFEKNKVVEKKEKGMK